MKTKTFLPLLALAYLSTFTTFYVAQLSTVFAQGSLTPPGAPAPTMKTLQQVEPRTAITNATAVTISTSGSYYLTTNIAVTAGTAITISADNVTLDLNGFTVSSTAASPSGTGILLSGTRAHIHILNGHIRGYVTYSGGVYSGGGFWSGISRGTTPRNVRVTGVSVSGCQYDGIYLGVGPAIVVESCTVNTVGGYGIYATSVSHSTAYQCGSHAIYAALASNCSGYSTGGDGLLATIASNCSGDGDIGLSVSIADNCSGTGGGSVAMSVGIANNCYADNYSAGIGLNVQYVAIGCRGGSISGTGISGYLLNSCRRIGTPAVTASYRYDMP